MDKKFQILSFDGGGIKGVFSIAVLAHIENDLNVKVVDYFDLIVGTSTGSIIALGLGIGLSPKEILEFYEQNSKIIFKKEILTYFRRIILNKYSPDELEKSLKKIFGNKELSDSVKRLVIPAYNLGNGDVYLFKTPHHSKFTRDRHCKLWEVAMASCAAPTYFPIFRKIDGIRLIDGGVWANNPVLVGIAEAMNYFKYTQSQIGVLSMGTSVEIKKRMKWLNNGGLLQWAFDAVEIVMDGQSIGAANIARHIVGKDNYLRINTIVPNNMFKLDRKNIKELKSEASVVSRKYVSDIKAKFFNHDTTNYSPCQGEE